MKLFSHLRENYGQKVVIATRTVEKLEEKVSRYRNHVVFNLRCWDTGIIPPSLRLKTPIKTEVSNNKLRSLRSELDLRKKDLLSLFSSNDDDMKQAVLDRLEKSREFTYKQTTWCHVEN